jgi:hypothetical protein
LGPAAHSPDAAGTPVQATQQQLPNRQQQQLRSYSGMYITQHIWLVYDTQGISV